MNRRDLLKTAPLAFLAGGAFAAPQSEDEQIRHHAAELLRLLSGQLPEGCTVSASITPGGHIHGRALRPVWRPEPRMTAGGYWIEERAGCSGTSSFSVPDTNICSKAFFR